MSEFSPGELGILGELAHKVAALADTADCRLVVEVYDRGDTQALAWIEYYPGDSDPVIRFTRERPE